MIERSKSANTDSIPNMGFAARRGRVDALGLEE
jgi:hypothetical protein